MEKNLKVDVSNKKEVLFDEEIYPEAKNGTRTYFRDFPLDEEKTFDSELYPEFR